MVRNIVLICLDCVRKDSFDAQAKRLGSLTSVSFDQCRAASSWSVPSHASMMTGELPHRHGIHTHNRDFSSLERDDTFLGELSGHDAIGVSANAWASSDFGFDVAFDEFCNIARSHRFPRGINARRFAGGDGDGASIYVDFLKAILNHDYPAKSLANGVLAQIQEASEFLPIPSPIDDGCKIVLREALERTRAAAEPYFLFINLMDAHEPLHPIWGYGLSSSSVPLSWQSTERTVWDLMNNTDDRTHEEYWANRRTVYAAAIDYLDRRLARFVRRLLDESRRETTVIVTADHGENLGSHKDCYLANHKSGLTEGLLHVPFSVINPPSGYMPREKQYFSHLELRRLIAGLSTGETPDVFAERVPAELVGMSAGPEPPNDRDWWDRMMRCVYDGQQKMVWDSLGKCEMYSLNADRPGWQRKVGDFDGIPSWTDEFFTADIRSYKESTATSQPKPDATMEQRLRDLGYM